MLQSVGFTLFTRLTGAVLNFLSMVLLSRVLGPEARGVCSWYLVVIASSLVFSEMVAGPAAGYLLRTYPASIIRKVAYTWAVIPVLLVNSLFLLLGKVSLAEYWLLLMLCWLNAANTLQLHLLLARQKIIAFNFLNLLGPALTLVSIYLFTRSGTPLAISYLYALLLSWVLAFIAAFLVSRRTGEMANSSFSIGQVIREGFTYGVHNQAGHLASLVQNRLVFFLLPAGMLGIYANALSLGEALLMLPGSIGQMLYARVLNEKDQTTVSGTVSTAWWITLGLMLLATAVVFLVPDQFYQWLFGEKFAGVKGYLLVLVPGLMFYAGYLVMSYWQSANGRFIYNFYAIMTGVVITLVSCFLLWQMHRLTAFSAATATAAGWVVIFFASAYQFTRGKKATGNLWPPPAIRQVLRMIRK